jgi:hypothetical protein
VYEFGAKNKNPNVNQISGPFKWRERKSTVEDQNWKEMFCGGALISFHNSNRCMQKKQTADACC